MKKSNKILLGFALTLLFLPVLVMAIVSRVYYEEGNGSNRYQVDVANSKTLATPNRNMESKLINQQFSEVIIEDAKRLGLLVKVYQSANAGLKISKYLSGKLDYQVDAEGRLIIKFKQKSDNDRRMYKEIYIYGQAIQKATIVNASFVSFSSNVADMDLTVNQAERFYIEEFPSSIRVNTNVEYFQVDQKQINNLTMNLDGTKFRTWATSFNELSIVAKGKSSIEMHGEVNGKSTNLTKIKKLNLQTLNAAEVDIENMTIDNCSGSFSNETQVKMPAINLNQMYKK